ncbi:MAG: aldo/keto reductase [Oscillospiraceae bacterium]|jgi:predicted aldo/keto reductase-like oxidoreductase|nr:aldo/keto reductase [Oscillospiraceae bacterium]
MQYRNYGSISGEKISALGFGCMRLPEVEADGKWRVDEEKSTPLLRRAKELGVNYFDTGYYYCHHNSESAVGKAVKPFRSDVLLSTKIPMGELKEAGDYRRWLERSLRELDTDYVDFYHFWSLDKTTFDDKVIGFKLLDEARKAKEEGLIRHISFSFHDDAQAIRHIIDRGEIFETMLVQYNLLDRSNEEMIAYASAKGLGVAAMGPVGGGRLAAPTELYSRLTGKGSLPTYELALRFVLGNPHINCALSGMQDLAMLEKNIRVGSDETPLNAAEWQQIGDALEKLRRFSDLYCTGCAYCQPCPAGIDIPKIFSAYTYHNVYELHNHAAQMFAEYTKKGGNTLKSCKNCGFCERKCPQHLSIRQELARVESALEKLGVPA